MIRTTYEETTIRGIRTAERYCLTEREEVERCFAQTRSVVEFARVVTEASLIKPEDNLMDVLLEMLVEGETAAKREAAPHPGRQKTDEAQRLARLPR